MRNSPGGCCGHSRRPRFDIIPPKPLPHGLNPPDIYVIKSEPQNIQQGISNEEVLVPSTFCSSEFDILRFNSIPQMRSKLSLRESAYNSSAEIGPSGSSLSSLLGGTAATGVSGAPFNATC